MKIATIDTYRQYGSRYLVKDRQTDRIIGQYKFRNAARNKRDKLDLEYGAIRYYITFEGREVL